MGTPDQVMVAFKALNTELDRFQARLTRLSPLLDLTDEAIHASMFSHLATDEKCLRAAIGRLENVLESPEKEDRLKYLGGALVLLIPIFLRLAGEQPSEDATAERLDDEQRGPREG